MLREHGGSKTPCSYLACNGRFTTVVAEGAGPQRLRTRCDKPNQHTYYIADQIDGDTWIHTIRYQVCILLAGAMEKFYDTSFLLFIHREATAAISSQPHCMV